MPDHKKMVQERLRTVPEDIRSLITNGSLDAVTEKSVSQFSLSPSQAVGLFNELLLTLLFFCSKRTLVNRLVETLGIDNKTAVDLSNFVTEQNLFSTNKELYEEFANLEEKGSEAEVVNHPSDDLSTEIAETEAALKAQPTIRTMADDMQKSAPPGSTTDEPVYTTTQEALLQEGRWETAADKARPDAPKQ